MNKCGVKQNLLGQKKERKRRDDSEHKGYFNKPAALTYSLSMYSQKNLQTTAIGKWLTPD